MPCTVNLAVGVLVIGRFLLLLHASGTVCHYTSLQRHLERLSKEAEAVFVQLQLIVLIFCSYSCNFVLGPAAFRLIC